MLTIGERVGWAGAASGNQCCDRLRQFVISRPLRGLLRSLLASVHGDLRKTVPQGRISKTGQQSRSIGLGIQPLDEQRRVVVAQGARMDLHDEAIFKAHQRHLGKHLGAEQPGIGGAGGPDLDPVEQRLGLMHCKISREQAAWIEAQRAWHLAVFQVAA